MFAMNRTTNYVIDVRNHSAVTSKDLLPLLRETLTMTQTEVEWTGNDYVPETTKVRMWEHQSEQLLFPAGLVERVRNHAKNRGIDVAVRDQSHWPCMKIAKKQLASFPKFNEFEQKFLRRVVDHPHGQITGFSDHEQMICIGLMARAFESLQVLVVAKNKERCRRIATKVRGTLKRISSANIEDPGRLGFCCLSGLLASWWEMWDVLILADPEVALADQIAKWNPFSRPARQLYVFVPKGYALDQSESLHLEASVGGSIVDKKSPTQRNRAVKVQFYPGPVIRSLERFSGLDWKRKAIWHNQQRNSAIADLAQGYLKRSANGSHRTSGRRRVSVGILVESVEHGRELQKLLPMFELLSGNSTICCHARLWHKQIGTHCFADEWGIEVDILIRADGTDDWPLEAMFQGRHPKIAYKALLIDFRDSGNKEAERKVKSRTEAYQRFGWLVSHDNRCMRRQSP